MTIVISSVSFFRLVCYVATLEINQKVQFLFWEGLVESFSKLQSEDTLRIAKL